MSKLTKAANGMPCIRCGKIGETRACHYNGPRQHDFGKGRGIKANDIATAEFCQSCDDRFTEGSTDDFWANKWERSEEFMYWSILTNIRRFNEGVLKL